jgi:hypothetical protein
MAKMKPLSELMEAVLAQDLQGTLEKHWAIRGPVATIDALLRRGLIVIVGHDPLTARLTPAGLVEWKRIRAAWAVAA